MYSAIQTNKRNTILIIAVFMMIVVGLGFLAAGMLDDYALGWVIAIGSLIYIVFEYYMASRIAISMAGGKEIGKKDNPILWNTVENLCIASGMPMPRVFIINDPAPNAFATGRDPKHAYVAVTTGLLEIMDKRELNAVMGHELSHVKNYDVRVSMIVFGIVAVIGVLSDLMMRIAFYSDNRNKEGTSMAMIFGIVAAILAPLVAVIIQLAVSRQREYLADASSCLLTRDPDAMASALAKLADNSRPMLRQNGSMAHLYINNPMKRGMFSKLFSTHPPIEDRINRIQQNSTRI